MSEREPLDGLATHDGAAPPMGAALEAALVGLRPTATRRPARQAALVLGGSIAWALALVGVMHLRRDLGDLPRTWLILYLSAWLVGFVVPTVLLVVPRPGSMLPRWRIAAIFGALAGVGFVAAGLMLARSAPTSSTHTGLGHLCMANGLLTALAPTLLGVLALRGAVPTATRTAAAALGAGAGCIGGFALHLHCPVADGMHVGLAHGGVVLISAVLAALIAPRWLAKR